MGISLFYFPFAFAEAFLVFFCACEQDDNNKRAENKNTERDFNFMISFLRNELQIQQCKNHSNSEKF